MRILIVEDEPKTATYVRKGLMEHGYVVDVASDGLDGLHLATTTEYDLILLDVMLPGIDGWSVLQGVRQQRQTPVLFLSARDQVDDRVKGLKLGADDYLVKPFAFSELLARVQNILRRGQAPRDQTLRIADLEVDPVRRRVTRGGDRIDLTAKEYALLEFLVLHHDRIVGREAIARHVWDESFDAFTNVIDVYIKRLRAKLDTPGAPRLIHTRRGEGYILTTKAEAGDVADG